MADVADTKQGTAGGQDDSMIELATARRAAPESSGPRDREHNEIERSAPADVSPVEAGLHDVKEAERYEARRRLGRGGMGEVRLCKDARIGREVAMKVMLPAHTSD